MTNPQPDSLAAAYQMLEQFGSTPEAAKAVLLQEKATFEAAVAKKQAVWMEPRGEGVWTAAQITEHVILISSLFLRIVQLFKRAELPEISMPKGEFKKGKPQSPPRGLPSSGKTWEELEPLWVELHTELLELISSTNWDDTRTLEHPFFGPLRPLQWLQCTNYHTHHHVQQL